MCHNTECGGVFRGNMFNVGCLLGIDRNVSQFSCREDCIACSVCHGQCREDGEQEYGHCRHAQDAV